ncbi:MAG: ATP-binding cassette domain-containing protein, partial [Synergistetes bacterium]|nr:ATP-binding cassette domain-containing protein [Synergistota bacterium]
RRYIGFVSQDRKYTGLALQSTVMKNIIMTHHIGQMLKRMKFTIDWDRAKGFSRRLVDSYAIVCRDVHESVSTLSGGNQQKVVVAREFSLDVPFLLLDQPTRGLDVGTIEFIHQRILQMRGNGMAILLISAELDELFTLSDKIYVMRGGKIVAELVPSLTTKEEVGAYMLGVGAHGQEQ